MTAFVAEQRPHAHADRSLLRTPEEHVYPAPPGLADAAPEEPAP